MTRLRSQHEWLLFFSVPKQLLLYRLIQEWNEENTENLVDLLLKEVMFLVSNEHQTRELLSEDIQVRRQCTCVLNCMCVYQALPMYSRSMCNATFKLKLHSACVC